MSGAAWGRDLGFGEGMLQLTEATPSVTLLDHSRTGQNSETPSLSGETHPYTSFKLYFLLGSDGPRCTGEQAVGG